MLSGRHMYWSGSSSSKGRWQYPIDNLISFEIKFPMESIRTVFNYCKKKQYQKPMTTGAQTKLLMISLCTCESGMWV